MVAYQKPIDQRGEGGQLKGVNLKKGTKRSVIAIQESFLVWLRFTVPETNIFAPEKSWLGDDPFLLGFGLFSGAMLVLGRVPPSPPQKKTNLTNVPGRSMVGRCRVLSEMVPFLGDIR